MTENTSEDAEVTGPETPAEDDSLADRLIGPQGAGPESADPDPDFRPGTTDPK